MSTLSELQKKLQQESQGIMFPFSAATSAVNTTQQVYDSSTDGIMTMTGKKYTGPNAVVQYGTEAQGYPRQLKQIEAPMLPQVSNLPPAGTGIVENAPGTPITTTPFEPSPEAPAVNPCPSGYRLVNGVCQLIPQRNDDEPPIQPRGENVYKNSLKGFLRHEELKNAINNSSYETMAGIGETGPQRLSDITTTESTQTLGGSTTNDLQDKGVVIPNAERGTAGYIMGTAGTTPGTQITNKSETIDIDVTKELQTAKLDSFLVGGIFSALVPGLGLLAGGILNKSYENTLLGQLNGLADFGVIERPEEGFKITKSADGKRDIIAGITTTTQSKNKIRQLYSDALPEFNSKTRKELSTEYLDKTKEYQEALFKGGNRSLMEGVSDKEQKEYADRTSQGGFGGFEARNDRSAKGNQAREDARKKAEAAADKYAKEKADAKANPDDSWKDKYNWSGPNNSGTIVQEKKKENRGSGSGSGKSRVICTELHSTGELSTKDWIRDTQFTFKHLSKTHVKGYLAWAIPTVKHIQKYKMYRKLWKHIAQHRANDIAWRLNQGKFDVLGRVYASIGESLCWVIGNFVSDYNLNKLGVNKQWQNK
jgi:hypothetical protein